MREHRADLHVVRLVLMFGIAFSLAGLPGTLSSFSQLPRIPAASACVGCVPNSSWYPSGPAMNTELVNIFSSGAAELSALCAGSIDLTDISTGPLPCSNAALTTPVSSHDYFEIEFNLGNNFWGVPFQFGNSASGVQIRQGIAHLFDKNVFVNNDPSIAGRSISIDNPLPPSDGLPAANPCGWDSLFPESGSSCVVGAAGGLAYHLASASGLCGNETVQAACLFPWMPGFASPDFCAAAQHFIAAGLATGKDTNCVLTGVKTSSLVAHPVDFIAKSDRPARYNLATGLTQAICALFTGSFTVGCISGSPGTGCTTTVPGASLPANAIICLTPVTGYPACVFETPLTSVNLCWGLYTGGFGGVFPFDSSLYFIYNSLLVSGGSFDHPPCAATTATNYPSNYLYMCVPAYDSTSTQMEFAPCLSASGDPAPGQTAPTFADCLGTTKLTSVSAGYQTEDLFGRGAYTIPLYSDAFQFAYLSNWARVINADGVGLPNYFTWLDAYSANPAVAGTMRQGFSQLTFSLNPYAARTLQDFYFLGNIYDSLYMSNPSSPSQVIDWMTVSDRVLNNTQLGYTPPAGTVASIRNVLRSDLFWQDGAKASAWDVKFAFLTYLTCPACQFQGSLSPVVDVHVLSPSVFDINLRSMGPFTKLALGSVPIIPGRHWSVCSTATWDVDVAAGNVPSSCIAVSSTKSSVTFDPLAAGILIGSGPWMCKNPSTGVIGGGCSSTGSQNPPPGGSYTLTRFGIGTQPGASLNSYFRSNGDLALDIWSGNTGDSTHDIINISAVAVCFEKPLGTIGCTHWQKGIGAPGGSSVIGITQVAEVARFFGVSWTSPFAWNDLTGIAAFPPVLYEGTVTLNPCSIDPINGYDC